MNFNDIKDIKDLQQMLPTDHSGTGAGKTDYAGPCDRWTETDRI